MKEALWVVFSASLMQNFVLVKFLGLCPIMGVSKKVDNAIGMSLATMFVLTLTAILTTLIHQYILVPFELEYLRLLVFIFSIAVIVQATELMLRLTNPLLHQVLGIFLPLITTNCAVLGLALLNVNAQNDLLTAVAYGIGTALGFSLVLILFATLREKLDSAAIPDAFSGTPIALITIGIMAMAFMGFS